jgi:CelD/BcsL family acetyltransferase involved in cellulose biosynthesis
MSTEATARAPLTSSGAAAYAVTPAAPAVRAGAAALEVETVTSLEALRALEPAWTRLLDEAEIDHPFLAHEWIVTWWESFAAGRSLHILLVKDASGPVAIAPFMLTRVRVYGLTARRLELIANVHTQRADFIVSARCEQAYRAIWDHLARERDLWDVLLLPQVPAASRTMEWLPKLATAAGHSWGAWRAARSPRIVLGGSWEAYESGLPRKHRSNLRNRMKRLSLLGAVELEVVTGEPELDEALRDGFVLEGAAWKEQGGTAIRCRPELQGFYARLGERAARQGWLQLQFLKVAGRRIAFGYALRFKDTLYLLKPGYDPAFAAYSPSSLLCAMVLRAAIAQGLRAYDLLGDDDAWKRAWTDEVRAHCWLFVFGRGTKGRLLYFLKFRFLPWLRRTWALLRARRRTAAAAGESA